LVVHHPESVATTWSLAFEKVKQAHPAAIELLQVCAFLHPDAIPEELLSEGAAELGPVLGPVAADPLELDAAIEALRMYSLVRRSADTHMLTIHRLVQAVLTDQMDEHTQRQWAERTVQAVSRAFPEVEFATRQRCQRYFSHALACAALIEQWGLAFPAAAQLLNRAGNYLRECGRYKEAEPLLLQALAIYLFQRTLTIRERSLGPKHPYVAQTLHRLAKLYYLQGNYAQAEPLLTRSLVIREQALGVDHPDVAYSLDTMALLALAQGKSTQAEQFCQRTLKIREQALGPEHLEVAVSLTTLAQVYLAQGKYTQVEPLLQRALSIREPTLGPDHPEVANCLELYTRLLRRMDHQHEAAQLEARARAIRATSTTAQ
jgi:tetratricopeptide (TPR) repeat protein